MRELRTCEMQQKVYAQFERWRADTLDREKIMPAFNFYYFIYIL